MNEIELSIHILRNHFKSILIGCFIGAFIAFLISISQTPVWRATMIVAPTDRTGMPSLSSFLPQSAADAPALQYFVERIDAAQSNDFTIFETLVTSPSILKQLSDDIRPNDYRQYFKNNLKIRPHGLSQFRRITLDHTDKAKAVAILNQLYTLSDQSIRKDKKIKTTRRISYLELQLKTIQNPNHRDAIIALLREQEQTAMMASIDNEFAAKIVEPPYLSARPVAPNAKILFPILCAIGGFIGFVISRLRK